MITLQNKLPFVIYVAVSGGVDSMALLDFLSRKHSVTVLHFNHGTPNADNFEKTVVDYCTEKQIAVFTGDLNEYAEFDYDGKQSLEEYWRNARYRFFNQYTDKPVITCHHLDDCVEQFMFSAIRHGEGKVIPYSNGNVIRPFRLTEKKFFMTWAKKYNVPFTHDESNDDVNFDRNYIRHEMMPHVLRINPGIKKVIRKKIKKEKIVEQKENEISNFKIYDDVKLKNSNSNLTGRVYKFNHVDDVILVYWYDEKDNFVSEYWYKTNDLEKIS